jgi:nitrogen fixation NifU-like protein
MADSGDERLDLLAQELQRMVLDSAREIYSSEVIAEWSDPLNVGLLAEPDGYAWLRGGCGDTMEFTIKVEDDRLAEVAFMTDGCGPTVACGSRLTCLVWGLPLSEAMEFPAEQLIEALGGLPEESIHCAHLAVDTLRKAIENHQTGSVVGHTGQYTRLRGLLEDNLSREEAATRASVLLQQGYH